MRFAVAVSALSSLTALSFLAPAVRLTSAPPVSPTPVADRFIRFAAAVAVAGDEVLVGRTGGSARRDTWMGGVHIFRRGPMGRWIETAVLAPRDLTSDDGFGAALATDGTRLAVGAPGAEHGRGAVYLFARKRAGQWVLRTKLVAPSGIAGDSLGQAVAFHGDVVLAGAPAHANHRGLAVVFRRRPDASHWTEQAVLPAPDTVQEHRFGQALAITGDRLFVGAPGPSVHELQRIFRIGGPPSRLPPRLLPGQVVVFRDSSRTWVVDRRITVAGDSQARGFGSAIVAQGATFWASSPLMRGSVHEFHRERTGQWGQVASISADPSSGFGFGQALAYDGRELIVGAPVEHDTGAVYVFRADSSASEASWRQVQRLSLTGHLEQPMVFGDQLAVDSGVLIAGTPWGDNHEGLAVIYQHSSATGGWGEMQTIVDTAWNLQRPLISGAAPCTAGRAKGIFDCRNTELLAFLPNSALGNTRMSGGYLSGVWGWTDTVTSREFALVGRSDGTAFIEVTDPERPKYLGNLPLTTGATPSIWRDIKIYKAYAFIVAETGVDTRHGIQIFDLTVLRHVTNPPVAFTEAAHYDNVASVHTLAVDTATGFIYAAGGKGDGMTCNGGLHMVDVRDPLHAVFAGCYNEARLGTGGSGYVHETQCVVYHGPDRPYQGREICFTAAETALGVADVTDKQHPKTISISTYPNVGYVHQGWLTDDQRYFFLGDEFDEQRDGGHTRTLVFDVANLADPVLANEFIGTTVATDHNMYIRGRHAFQANYLAGLRILDIGDPVHPREVGYFDTTPGDAITPELEGAWSNYPFFKSGAIAVTSSKEGLFLIRYQPTIGPDR